MLELSEGVLVFGVRVRESEGKRWDWKERKVVGVSRYVKAISYAKCACVCVHVCACVCVMCVMCVCVCVCVCVMIAKLVRAIACTEQ